MLVLGIGFDSWRYKKTPLGDFELLKPLEKHYECILIQRPSTFRLICTFLLLSNLVVTLFPQIINDEYQCRYLLCTLRAASFEAETTLYNYGDAAEEIFFIVRGSVLCRERNYSYR